MPANDDWASALWLQQHSESAFFGTPCIHFHHCPRQCPMHPSSEHYFNSSQASEKQIKYVKKLFFIWFLKIAKILIFFHHWGYRFWRRQHVNYSSQTFAFLWSQRYFDIVTREIFQDCESERKSESSNIQAWSLDVKASFSLGTVLIASWPLQ